MKSQTSSNRYAAFADEFDAAERTARESAAKSKTERADEHMRLAGVVWSRWADAVFQDMHSFKRGAVFSKPSGLPTFLMIRAAQDKLRSGGVSKKARELVGQYNVWLDTVLRAESENAGMMNVLLKAYCLLGESRRGEMRRYLERNWCRSGEWREPVDDYFELDKLARWHCRNEDTLPTWLLDGSDIPDSAYESEGFAFDHDAFNDAFEDERRAPRRSADSSDEMTVPDFSPGSSHD